MRLGVTPFLCLHPDSSPQKLPLPCDSTQPVYVCVSTQTYRAQDAMDEFFKWVNPRTGHDTGVQSGVSADISDTAWDRGRELESRWSNWGARGVVLGPCPESDIEQPQGRFTGTCHSVCTLHFKSPQGPTRIAVGSNKASVWMSSTELAGG